MAGEEWPEDWPELVERAKATLGELGEVREAVKSVALLIRDVRTEERDKSSRELARCRNIIRERNKHVRNLRAMLAQLQP